MKKNYLLAVLMATSSVLLMTDVYASKLKVINNGHEPMFIYFKGKGDSKYYIQPHTGSSSVTYEVTSEMISGKDVFEVIASKTGSGNPDLKLLAGSCKNLITDKNYILLVEPGFKTSCDVLGEK